MRIGGGLPLSIMAGVSANGLTRLSEKWNRQENDVCGDHGARTGCLRGEQDRRSAGPHGDARIPASTSCKGGWRTSPCRPFPTKPKPRLFRQEQDTGDRVLRTCRPRRICLRLLSLSPGVRDRKSTRLNSSHGYISYAVFCLKNKNLVRFR